MVPRIGSTMRELTQSNLTPSTSIDEDADKPPVEVGAWFGKTGRGTDSARAAVQRERAEAEFLREAGHVAT